MSKNINNVGLVTQMLTNYEQDKTAENLENFGASIVNSVLNKVYSASGNFAIEKMRRQFWADFNRTHEIKYLLDDAYALEYTKDGELRQTVNGDLDKKATEKLCISYSNGYDLLQVAILKILDLEAEGHENLLEQYKIKTLDKRVLIGEKNSASWKYQDTSGLHEIFLAVRREIEQHQSTNINNKYLYLDELLEDEEGNVEQVYRRLHANNIYATLDGAVKNNTYATVTEQDEQDINALIIKLKLSARENEILKLRIKGYGYKAIATYLGIPTDSVKKYIKRIRVKAQQNGLYQA